MAIPTSGNISIKEAAGSDRSIDTAVTSVSSGSLHTLGALNAISHTTGTAPPGGSAQTNEAPTGMREFYGYAHTFATSYFTTLRSEWEADAIGQVVASAQITLKVIYENNNINIYGKTSGVPGGLIGASPGSNYTLAYRVSNAPAGYTVRYTYSHISGDGPFPWDTGTWYNYQEGEINKHSGTISTTASSIGSGVTMVFTAEAGADDYGGPWVSTSNEVGTVTLYLEKSGETTYSWPGAVDILARASSID